MKDNSRFFLVKEDVMPESLKKTIRIKEILQAGQAKTINEAVEQVNLSRSAYYKYKDHVFPFFEASKEKIVSISILLVHKPGTLSSVLNTIADDYGSVITINQSIPTHGLANINLTIETKGLTIELEALLDKLRLLDGVRELEVLGQI